ncbi:MAG TPA: cupin domain-containing protein [Dongiaceae bacterium]|jgi:quercetin dioxygenase-like cupin family protein|nr:cupin domain-containing protein [Dongiaceae bacterium]
MKRAILAAGALVFAAATFIPAHAGGTIKIKETVTPVFEHELPNVPGKSLIAFEVEYPAGGASPSHTHPKSAFIYAYVLSGEILSAVDDEKPRIYRAGEGWYEVPGAHHRVSRNASKTEPAKLLAIFVMDPGERQVVFPDAK